MNKLVISRFYNDILLGFLFKDDVLQRVYPFEVDLVENIYAGHVKDVVKNINSAFVEFANGEKGFLPLKYDEDKELKQGEKVLVQVSADKVKTKDYVLTTNISLKSKDLVLTSKNKSISVSKKITDNDTKNHLKQILANISQDVGFIVRTSAQNVDDNELRKQAIELLEDYKSIENKFNYSTPKALLHSNNSLYTVCDELANSDDTTFITDIEEIYNILINEGFNCLYNDDNKVSLQNKYSLGKHIDNILNKKVWLKSGGYLVIEHTEALTVIDVNTGKADAKKNKEETIFKINEEAAKEIIRQLQLRNITGMIIIDFINMKVEASKDSIYRAMNEYAKYDYTQCSVVGFTKLGLMEMTRKKQHKPIYEILR